MAQKKIPLINSAHGSETRNIINELIKLFNNMGYTYNESLQKAQDILDEAQQTNDMNESVQQQINTLIAESGTSDAEVLQARIDAEGNEFPVVKERLDHNDGIRKSHGESIDAHDRALDYWWKPEQQPPARTDKTGWFIDGYAVKANEVYENFLDPFVTNNPSYVSKQLLGKDQSGEHDIYSYTFTPEHYKKTLIITTALHGSEKTPLFTMLRFLHYLVNESDKYPTYSKIREEVKIIYIPIANPYGFNEDIRQNSRGVDLNRNFDYKFDSYEGDPNPFDQNYKGTAPFSEVESQYIKNVLDENTDSIYLDMHNTGTNNFQLYVAKPENFKYRIYDKIFNQFKHDFSNPVIVDGNMTEPAAANYAYNTLGIISSIPEWCDKNYGSSLYESIEITKALELFSNTIFEHYRTFGEASTEVLESRFVYGGVNDITVDSTSYVNIGSLQRQVPINFHGLAIFRGYVTVGLLSGSGNFYVIPRFGQYGNGLGTTPNTYQMQKWENYSGGGAGQRFTIPFEAVIPIKPTNSSAGVDVASTGIFSKVDGDANYRIFRYYSTLTLIPDSAGKHSYTYTLLD